MNYYGTDLRDYGHYFWKLEGDRMLYQSSYTAKDFDVESIVPRDAQKGEVTYTKIAGWSICGIAGSCKDTRGGTKSIFWVEGEIEPSALKDAILAIPIAKKMIEQMPFEVKW